MNHDLGLTNTQFGSAAGFFFLGYLGRSGRVRQIDL